MVIPLGEPRKRCERCGKMFEDLFNGAVCAVCYVAYSTEIIELDKLMDIKSRRQAALKEK